MLMINMKKDEFIKRVNPLLLKGIAHRGLHNEKFTENGLLAFKNAIDHNVAIELDVHLTKDDRLIVCHDDDLVRTTGKEGIIEELTVSEIKSNYKLLDGEEVPLFEEVLSLINEKVPLVIELKVRNANYKALVQRLLYELKDIKDKRNYHLISFDPRALLKMKEIDITNSLLVTTSHIWTFKLRHLFDSVDLEYKMINMPKVRKYQKKHFVNVWTIETLDELNLIKGKVDTITFQKLDPKLISECL